MSNVRRINVTFPPEVHAAILECSTVSGIAASQIVALLMSSTLPVLHGMTKAFRVARTDPTAAIEVMSDLARRATVDAAQTTLDLERAKVRRPRRTTKQ